MLLHRMTCLNGNHTVDENKVGMKIGCVRVNEIEKVQNVRGLRSFELSMGCHVRLSILNFSFLTFSMGDTDCTGLALKAIMPMFIKSLEFTCKPITQTIHPSYGNLFGAMKRLNCALKTVQFIRIHTAELLYSMNFVFRVWFCKRSNTQFAIIVIPGVRCNIEKCNLHIIKDGCTYANTTNNHFT